MKPKTWSFLSVAAAVVFGQALTVLADYTLVLKNGRQITVQSYREEKGMIKFDALGGEIGITKDQIQAIRRTGVGESGGLNVQQLETISQSGAERRGPAQTSGPQPAKEKPLTPEEEREREAKQYQQKLQSVTEQIKNLRDRYAEATRGTTSAEPTLITSQEGIKTLQEAAISRRLDSLHNPVDPGQLKLLTPSPFTTHSQAFTEVSATPDTEARFSTPLPAYTEKEKELSVLRNKTLELETQREKLIEEMRQKNFAIGSLFLE